MISELKQSEVSALREACRCLFIQVPESVATDIQTKAEAVIALLNSRVEAKEASPDSRERAREAVWEWKDAHTKTLCCHGYSGGCQECREPSRMDGPLKIVAPWDSLEDLVDRITAALDARPQASEPTVTEALEELRELLPAGRLPRINCGLNPDGPYFQIGYLRDRDATLHVILSRPKLTEALAAVKQWVKEQGK